MVRLGWCWTRINGCVSRRWRRSASRRAPERGHWCGQSGGGGGGGVAFVARRPLAVALGPLRGRVRRAGSTSGVGQISLPMAAHCRLRPLFCHTLVHSGAWCPRRCSESWASLVGGAPCRWRAMAAVAAVAARERPSFPRHAGGGQVGPVASSVAMRQAEVGADGRWEVAPRSAGGALRRGGRARPPVSGRMVALATGRPAARPLARSRAAPLAPTTLRQCQLLALRRHALFVTQSAASPPA